MTDNGVQDYKILVKGSQNPKCRAKYVIVGHLLQNLPFSGPNNNICK